MWTPDRIYEVLEAQREALGLSQAEVGFRAFGRADTSALQGIKRGSSPSVEKLEALCAALNLDFYFGPQREVRPVESVILDGAEYAHIPIHEASLSAGPGVGNDGGSNIIDHLAFRLDWLRRIGVSPARACIARVLRDSMEPTLKSGDLVLIDQAKADPVIRRRSEMDRRLPPIYAFVQAGEARVKRIERPDTSTIILISDNPIVAPEIYTGTDAEELSMMIIGKVVWSGHTIRS
jgi:phage repressor protein C with HTH and peptisase S24 domain